MRYMAIAILGLVGVCVSGYPTSAQQLANPTTRGGGSEAPTPAEDRLRGWEQRQAMDRESPFADLQWRAVGPQKQGGRIESIAIPAGETTTFYVGVGSGNL